MTRSIFLCARPLFIALGLGVASTAMADETDATLDAYAAGYKASFTCSAHFNAGKTLAQIAEHELSGIYPLIADRLDALPAAVIDGEAKRVSVTYDDDMPPRISQWRPHLGCVQLPVGADISTAAFMPRLALPFDESAVRRDDGAPWRQRAPVNGESGTAALDKVIGRALAGTDYGDGARTSAVLVATPDAILAEHYIEGFSPTTSQRTWSVAKSIAASVIGVAVEQGLLDLKAPAPVPEWQRPGDPRASVSLENLLHMGSGLDSNRAGNRTDRLYMGGGLVTDTATHRALEVKPGKRWKYANNDTLIAVRALRAKLGDGDKALAFPFTQLFHKIGMTHTFAETDWEGNFILSSQVWTTSRDLARLGLLYLADGLWDGERLLPEGWASYVARPAPAQPPAKSGSGRAIPGYGAQWWLFNERIADVPDDAYAAQGNRGQYLVVIPSQNLLIIRRGYDPTGTRFDITGFTADVVRALDAAG